MTPPSKQEILQKYRHLLDAEDFEILVSEGLPKPSDLQREGTWLEKLGTLDGFSVFVKKNVWGAVVSVILFVANYGDFFQGLETMEGHAKIAMNMVKSTVAKGTERLDVPADEYLVALPTERYSWTTTTSTTTTSTTTTTTTTGQPSSPVAELPSGSGLVPYNSAWGLIG